MNISIFALCLILAGSAFVLDAEEIKTSPEVMIQERYGSFCSEKFDLSKWNYICCFGLNSESISY